MLNRWYYTPARLAHILRLVFAVVTSRKQRRIWWNCLKASRLWIQVYALFRTLTQGNPFEALLFKPIDTPFRAERQLSTFLFTATKLTIARALKSPFLRFEAVKRHMDDIMANGKLTAVFFASRNKFLSVWQPWILYSHPSHYDHQLLDI